jgi:hypothetical protein
MPPTTVMTIKATSHMIDIMRKTLREIYINLGLVGFEIATL